MVNKVMRILTRCTESTLSHDEYLGTVQAYRWSCFDYTFSIAWVTRGQGWIGYRDCLRNWILQYAIGCA